MAAVVAAGGDAKGSGLNAVWPDPPSTGEAPGADSGLRRSEQSWNMTLGWWKAPPGVACGGADMSRRANSSGVPSTAPCGCCRGASSSSKGGVVVAVVAVIVVAPGGDEVVKRTGDGATASVVPFKRNGDGATTSAVLRNSDGATTSEVLLLPGDGGT